MERLSWEEIVQSEQYQGRWLALSNCRYDESSGQAVEGQIIDHDELLANLCGRLQEEERKSCAIVFCDGGAAAHAGDSETRSARCA